jgi:hypothetical protein
MIANSTDRADHCGAVLRARRREVGFESMAACAAASAELEARDPARFKRFGRSSLNGWELDPSGDSLDVAHGRAVRTLSYLLQWSGPDFSVYTGVPIGAVPRRPRPQRLPGRKPGPEGVGGVRVSIQLGAAPQTGGWSLEGELEPGATVIAEPGACRPGDLVVARLDDRQLVVLRLAPDLDRQPPLFTEVTDEALRRTARRFEILGKVTGGGEEHVRSEEKKKEKGR